MEGNTIVIGVDYCPIMTKGARWARDLLEPGAKVVLAHATEPAAIAPFLRHLVPPDHEVEDRLRDEARLRDWRDRVELPDADVIVRTGRADEVLRQVAIESRARCLVIGAHAEPQPPWKRLGTTAERLLRGADASLMVVRHPLRTAPRSILVALDDVEITPRVLAQAGELADRFGASLLAVHVLSPAAYSHLLSAEATQARTEQERREKVEADVAEEALRWLRALWANTRQHAWLDAAVPHGAPAREILRLAAERGADLIVMGRYGIGRVIPAVLGSVTGSVVAGADCSVLVVAS